MTDSLYQGSIDGEAAPGFQKNKYCTQTKKKKPIPTKIYIIPLKMINQYDRKCLGAEPWATHQIDPDRKKPIKKWEKN